MIGATVREWLRNPRELWRTLSTETKAILVLYLGMVVVHVLFRGGPALEAGALEPVQLGSKGTMMALRVGTPARDHAIAWIQQGEGAVWLLDWRRRPELGSASVADLKLATMRSRFQAAQLSTHDSRADFVMRVEGKLHAFRWQGEAISAPKPLPADTLWLRQDGSAVTTKDIGASAKDIEVESAWLSSGIAALRYKRGHAYNALYVFDTETAALLTSFKTLEIGRVFGVADWPGFLYIQDSLRGLEFVHCPEGRCTRDSVWVGHDQGVIVGADYWPQTGELALCTKTHVWFYEWFPGQRHGFYLGRAEIPDGDGHGVYFLGSQHLLVELKTEWRVLRFEGER